MGTPDQFGSAEVRLLRSDADFAEEAARQEAYESRGAIDAIMSLHQMSFVFWGALEAKDLVYFGWDRENAKDFQNFLQILWNGGDFKHQRKEMLQRGDADAWFDLEIIRLKLQRIIIKRLIEAIEEANDGEDDEGERAGYRTLLRVFMEIVLERGGGKSIPLLNRLGLISDEEIIRHAEEISICRQMLESTNKILFDLQAGQTRAIAGRWDSIKNYITSCKMGIDTDFAELSHEEIITKIQAVDRALRNRLHRLHRTFEFDIEACIKDRQNVGEAAAAETQASPQVNLQLVWDSQDPK